MRHIVTRTYIWGYRRHERHDTITCLKSPTDFVKQVPPCSKLEEHINAGYVVVLIFGFHDDGADEFEYVLMLQGSVDLHFFVYRLAILVRRFIGDIDQFAGCHAMIFDVHCLKHAGSNAAE